MTRIAVSPALTSPDGVRLVDAHTLLVVENTGALVRIALSGDTATATAFADDLDQPTSVIVARGCGCGCGWWRWRRRCRVRPPAGIAGDSVISPPALDLP